jgi:DNA-binding XRE family transcriptional regulator
MQKFSDITGRAEVVRTRLGLNKSQFSARIGIKPQTYNNFVGSQGSKPNMELFYGIVREFNVDPMWLLNGMGEPFASSQPPSNGRTLSEPRKSGSKLHGERKYSGAMLANLKEELDLVLSASRQGRTPLLNSNGICDRQAEFALDVIVHSFWMAPAETAALAIRMLEEFSRLAGEMQWIADRKTDLGQHS